MSTVSQAPYIHIEDLEGFVGEIRPESIVSRTVHKDDRMKATLFGFAAGQELTEHTAAKAAIVHIIKGEAEVTMGDDRFEARAGAWFYMQPKLPHSLVAHSEMIMLLIMLRD